MIKKTHIIWLITLLVLGSIASLIYQKETILSHGTTMLLPLAPVDPRSLIQGDYMTLRYALNRTINQTTYQQKILDGHVVVKLDFNQVAQFVRIHDNNTPLKPDEHLLQFRKRATGTRIASEAFFFQEGHANDFNHARFGEVKISDSGAAVLTGLRDNKYKPLIHKKPGAEKQQD